MRIDGWTLALQAVNVLILAWLLGRFLFRPVMDAIAARQAAADALLSDAQGARDEAAAETAALKARNAGFAADAARRTAEVQASVETERLRLLAQAKRDSDTLTDQARAAATAERLLMRADLERQAGVLAIDIAARLLGRIRPARGEAPMLQDLLDRIGTLDEEDRRTLAIDPALSVMTPDPLDDAAQNHVQSALGRLLPGIGTPIFVVDPTLIAGFELRGSHIRVRSSWRADLEDVSAKLLEDDHAS